jgi:hypothetical protein
LESFTNPVDELVRVAIRKISVHLDSVELKNGSFLLENEPFCKLDFEFFRWIDPKSIETQFVENTKKEVSAEYKIDKINKVISINFIINVNDFVSRIETKYDDNGGINTFESSEAKNFKVKVNLNLKYI